MSRYIDADKLSEEVSHGGHALSEWSTLGILAKINKQPTADVVEVRRGEWIEQIRDYGKYMETEGYECSICGYETMDNDYNYCPNCGARMDGDRREK